MIVPVLSLKSSSVETWTEHLTGKILFLGRIESFSHDSSVEISKTSESQTISFLYWEYEWIARQSTVFLQDLQISRGFFLVQKSKWDVYGNARFVYSFDSHIFVVYLPNGFSFPIDVNSSAIVERFTI